MTTTANPASSGSNPQASATAHAINIPDYVTIVDPAAKPSLHAIVTILAGMLTEHGDLPSPRCVSLSLGRDIDMQFAGTPDTFGAMAAWADRFGGTVTGEPGTDDTGPYVRCEVTFSYLGAQVRAYAYIKPARATA